jgi:hypothetical protein
MLPKRLVSPAVLVLSAMAMLTAICGEPVDDGPSSAESVETVRTITVTNPSVAFEVR